MVLLIFEIVQFTDLMNILIYKEVKFVFVYINKLEGTDMPFVLAWLLGVPISILLIIWIVSSIL